MNRPLLKLLYEFGAFLDGDSQDDLEYARHCATIAHYLSRYPSKDPRFDMVEEMGEDRAMLIAPAVISFLLSWISYQNETNGSPVDPEELQFDLHYLIENPALEIFVQAVLNAAGPMFIPLPEEAEEEQKDPDPDPTPGETPG